LPILVGLTFFLPNLPDCLERFGFRRLNVNDFDTRIVEDCSLTVHEMKMAAHP
jgi:hypothetical protein